MLNRMSPHPIKSFILNLLSLLYQLSRDNLEYLINPGIIPCRNLVAGVHSRISTSLTIPKVFGGVGYAAFEWDFSLGGVGVYEVGFGAYDVDYNVVGDVFLEFEKPGEC
jgi:hypothetical protein